MSSSVFQEKCRRCAQKPKFPEKGAVERAEIPYVGAASKSGTVWEGIRKQALPLMSLPLGAERAYKAGCKYLGVTQNACQMRV